MKIKTNKTAEVKTEAKMDKGFLVAHDCPFSRKRDEYNFLMKGGRFFSSNVEEAEVFPTMDAAEEGKAKANKQLRESNHPLEGLLFICEIVG